MPTIPKWIANGMERVFSAMMHPVTVTQVRYLDRRLKSIRFEGELSRTKFTPGNVIEFRVSDTAFRHYTPMLFHAQEGICEVLFYLHGQGPGSDWADSLQIGDQTKLMGPGGKMAYRNDGRYHFCFGDESSLGLCQALEKEAVQKEAHFRCLLELEDEHLNWPSFIGLSSTIVSKSVDPAAQAALRNMAAIPEAEWLFWQKANYYLTGRAQSIKALRKALLQRGVGRKQIQSYPYWADGKKGL